MAIEREASQHDQLGGVVARAQHSRTAERIGLEPPHQEAIEQAHHQRVLQVQMHPIGIHFLRIAEHHRLQLGVLPPLLSVLPRLQRWPQRIEHIPRLFRRLAAHQRWGTPKSPARDQRLPARDPEALGLGPDCHGVHP